MVDYEKWVMLNINSVHMEGDTRGDAECRGAFTEGTDSLGKDQSIPDIKAILRYTLLYRGKYTHTYTFIHRFAHRDSLYLIVIYGAPTPYITIRDREALCARAGGGRQA